MGFVKTAEEIRRIQAIYARCQFLNTRSLTVTFETTHEALAHILPPPLEPTPEALGTARVSDIGNSNCVGPFMTIALYVRARYQDTVGNYCVTSGMSTPEAALFSRDLWGEPARVGKLMFETQDEFVWGSGERYEVRFMSLRGRLTDPAATGRRDNSIFHFKYSPRADGHGFDVPPQLILVTADTTVESARRGRGELVFRDSPHDPVSEIPVKQVLEAVHTQGHSYISARTLCEVDPEAFMPYAFSRTDCFDMVKEGTLLHAQAARKSRVGRGQYRNGA